MSYYLGIIGDYPLQAVMAFYFLFICLFATSRYKIHSFIIFLSSILILSTAGTDTSQLARTITIEEYAKDAEISVMWDGVTALILTMFLFVDRVAWKQALLLVFAVSVHIMLIYDLTISSNLVSLFFYNYYDELIILIGILQITVSADGFNSALRKLRNYILWFRFYCHCYNKSTTLHKNSKGRA